MPDISDFKKWILGDLQTNTYLLWASDGSAMCIDPAESEPIDAFIQKNHFNLVFVGLTHGHFDHIGGVQKLIDRWNASLLIHPGDTAMLRDPSKNFSAYTNQPMAVSAKPRSVSHNEEIRLGNAVIKILEIPGHSPGSIGFLTHNRVWVGDALFYDSVGRTDLPGGSMTQLLESIHQRLMILDPDTRVFPGHGPDTTIQREKEENPFLEGIR
ncbi:MAG TPA: MBL fold metallo-hydrolase [bacterium]|nr:MBL fold metallo-hydrolase [bacterium]